MIVSLPPSSNCQNIWTGTTFSFGVAKQILILQMYCNATINIPFVQHQCELITICVALSTLYRHGQTMYLRILVNCSLVYLLDLYQIIRSLVNGSMINRKAPH